MFAIAVMINFNMFQFVTTLTALFSNSKETKEQLKSPGLTVLKNRTWKKTYTSLIVVDVT